MMHKNFTKTRFLLPALGLIGAILSVTIFGVPPGHADSGQGKGYLPGLGDLMNSSMEVHHLKLWFAGHADNWQLAAYEVKELRETIGDIQSYSPTWHNVPVGEMVKSLEPDLDLVAQAIKAKDAVKFDGAYQKLTESCNACHAAAGQPEIKIAEPPPQGGGPFSDQVFTTVNGSQ